MTLVRCIECANRRALNENSSGGDRAMALHGFFACREYPAAEYMAGDIGRNCLAFRAVKQGDLFGGLAP